MGRHMCAVEVRERELGWRGTVAEPLSRKKNELEDELNWAYVKLMQGVRNVELEGKLGIRSGKWSGTKGDLRDKLWRKNL